MFLNRPHLRLSRRCSVILSLSVLASALLAEPVDRVNLHIGTGDGVVAYGGTMPFVTTPFGMTNWTPQTRQNKVGGVSYKYQDSAITGFIGTHQPAIWMGDYGYVTIIPELDSIKTTPEERKLPFYHADEVTTPYYYSVSADAGQYRRIRTEITSTDHCAILRFTFPAIHNANIVVEATRPGIKGMIHFDPDKNEISGYNPDRMDAGLGPFVLPNFRGYFVVQFSKQSSNHGTYSNAALRPGAETAMDSNVGAYLTFETKGSETVEVKIGTSFISIDQARENLNREIPDWNFEAVSAKLKKLWNDKLGMFTLEGANADQEKIFIQPCIMRCSIPSYSPNTATITAPLMIKFIPASLTPPIPSGMFFAPSIACSLSSRPSEMAI
jgi:putative alpha-1,2-mannosidase